MSNVGTVTIKAEIPDRLQGEMEALMLETVRRLLDAHRPELMERFVMHALDCRHEKRRHSRPWQ